MLLIICLKNLLEHNLPKNPYKHNSESDSHRPSHPPGSLGFDATRPDGPDYTTTTDLGSGIFESGGGGGTNSR